MSADTPEKPDKKDGEVDVVMLRGATEDGVGTRVLRARRGHLETGEVRPLRHGKPLTSGEVVTLKQRTDEPALYDVKVEHVVEKARSVGVGPAQVATNAYRESWERVFGSGDRDSVN
jgi:hypothetical protein